MDDADRAEDRIETTIQDSLDAVRRRMAYRELMPTGFCHNPLCNTELNNNRLFCDKECSEDYERFKH